ncbi:MAG: C10 family peptidase [Bacteroidetes bacterium]|nr:C10 family peptidase [Bacteroidota bacterium]
MKKSLFSALLIFIVILSAYAENISVAYAEKAAKKIWIERAGMLKYGNPTDINLTLVYTEMYGNEPLYYVFNINTDEGFVIISADNAARPVIGYSFNGPFDTTNIPPSCRFLLGRYNEQLKFLKDNRLKASPEIQNDWLKLSGEDNKETKDIQTVYPLLLSKWNQSGYYNDSCPVSDGEQAIVGCVAVAMAQVMKYYNHPDQGENSYSYSYPPQFWPYGTLSANFGETEYRWANIPFKCTSQNPDIAQLLYHCGVSVKMRYGPDGSSSMTHKVESALIDYFRYNATYLEKDSTMTDEAWADIIRYEIDNKRPVVYSGSDDDGGHAWNCDGYQDDEFHMNWGWGGSADGYYTLDALIAGGYFFSHDFKIVKDIYPVSGYPEYCTGTKYINGKSGSFNDGSGNENYKNNINCLYLIQPECGTVINLSFDVFQIDSNDYITIYDGTTVSDSVIAVYFGNDIPSPVSTYKGALLIEFTTDEAITDIGWYASYTTKACTGIVTLTDPSAIITDGSGPCEYDISTYCRWKIAPPEADSLLFEFDSFELSPQEYLTYDYLKIYRDTILNENEIASFTINSPPTDTVIVPSGVAWLRFATNTSNNGQGWEISYTSFPLGIESKDLTRYDLNIRPNPFRTDAAIDLNFPGNKQIDITVSNMIGEIVGQCRISAIKGRNTLHLSDFMQITEPGVYFVMVTISGQTVVRKLVHCR